MLECLGVLELLGVLECVGLLELLTSRIRNFVSWPTSVTWRT